MPLIHYRKTQEYSSPVTALEVGSRVISLYLWKSEYTIWSRNGHKSTLNYKEQSSLPSSLMTASDRMAARERTLCIQEGCQREDYVFRKVAIERTCFQEVCHREDIMYSGRLL